MDLTREVFDRIVELAKPEMSELTDALGVVATYSSKPIHQVKAAAPELPEVVAVNSLQGFADLIAAGLESCDFSGSQIIHIESETRISLKSRETDEYGRRAVLIRAQPVGFEQFKFGQWHDQESFAIAVASRFSDADGSTDKAYVLDLAATLTNEATSQSDDDGFTQRATVKAGLALKNKVTIKPRVTLAPYRIFPEVAQPLSQFVFRARNTDQGPQLMLIEADGGAWKIAAINTLKAAMQAFNLNIPIVV